MAHLIPFNYFRGQDLERADLDLAQTFSAWGRKASQLEKVWDGPLKELYSKKEFLTQGLFFDGDISVNHPPGSYFSDHGFHFPLPDSETFQNIVDFDLSFDLFHLIELSGSAKDVISLSCY